MLSMVCNIEHLLKVEIIKIKLLIYFMYEFKLDTNNFPLLFTYTGWAKNLDRF